MLVLLPFKDVGRVLTSPQYLLKSCIKSFCLKIDKPFEKV